MQRGLPREPPFYGVLPVPIRSEGSRSPVPAPTIWIRETISRKNKADDSIFQSSCPSRRKRLALLMRIFITVRKNGLVFPSSSPGGEEGAWLRWKEDPEGHQPHRHILQIARSPALSPLGSIAPCWEGSGCTMLSTSSLLVLGNGLHGELKMRTGHHHCSAAIPQIRRSLLVIGFCPPRPKGAGARQRNPKNKVRCLHPPKQHPVKHSNIYNSSRLRAAIKIFFSSQ